MGLLEQIGLLLALIEMSACCMYGIMYCVIVHAHHCGTYADLTHAQLLLNICTYFTNVESSI